MLWSLVAFASILLAFVHEHGCKASVLHHAAPSNLTCYLCNSVDQDGEFCLDLSPNRTHTYYHECAPEESYCTLVRVKYIKDNTKESLMWSVERNCTKECQNGCITMGERTKLHMCRYCCKNNLCNMSTDRGVAAVAPCTTLLGFVMAAKIFGLF